ncbi:hypothetical protein N7474_005599 [Penicillium riverlandense]|uniref:uncharacterized protein n=1 Tax=Penicillium riverlandense TaxID=1903569 RepID=UPI0025478D94|nr:uncharacterized protein N7474_005599 [Penicillium riverlandense]KAJ5820008.1 hypothetical protein N7474_005599 [Penicillium riverlandense]
MSSKMSSSSEDSLSTLWETACTSYVQETGTALTSPDFPKLNTPSDLSSHLESEKEHFTDFRMKKRPLFHAMQTILSPFENFGDLISGAVSMAFPPASTIMGAMLLLIRAARRVSDAFDSINALFQKLGYFAQRLDSYRGVPLSEGMKAVIVKVLVTFLHVCGVSQSLLSRGSFRARFARMAKNVLVEDSSVQALLAELEELTGQEHKMVSAHSLNLTSQALKNTAVLLEKSKLEDERERMDRLKALLGPVSASGQVFSAISEGRIPGSGRWVEERIREWWDGNEPLLWIHGGPGVGKSYLASKIIGDLAQEEDAVVASFFCKNNDVDLRSFNKALRTLAWQVAVQRSTFAVHAEEFCLKGDPGNSYVVWRKLLLDYFEASSDDGVCFVIDGIDEADPDEQELFFSLLERTHSDGMERQPPVRVVLLGRDSVRSILDEHSLGLIDDIEITNNQNKDDLHSYVSQKLQKSKLFRDASDFQDEVVRDICTQAEGLWEWANLVIKNVLRCRTREQIRKVVKTMPKGISAMLREELQRLTRELSASDTMSGEEGFQLQQLNTILSFVTLAQRPLTVQHLDLILEILLGEEVLNLEDDLRTVYSSLFSLRLPVDGEDEYDRSAVVTLRHSSFYEFFESSSIDAGRVHVNHDQAGATFLFVMLYALAKSDAPSSYKFLGPLKVYAQTCLPLHLRSADPKQVATGRREDISSLLADLLTDESLLKNWIINETFIRFSASHNFHSSSNISKLGHFWWNSGDRHTANQVAEMVLDWLTPDKRRAFEETAGDNACPFAVLFSSMARFCSRLWLGPEDISDKDGLPEALCTLLFAYTEITATYTDSETSDKLTDITTHLRSGEIIHTAELQGLHKTAMWHARVAQALLQHYHFQDARKHFQLALDEHDKAPALSKQSLSVIHNDMARACSEIGRHKEALEHFDLVVSLSNDPEGPGYGLHGHIGNLLDAAHMEHRAKLTKKAISTAHRAWKEFTGAEHRDLIYSGLLLSFFVIFRELRQPHWFRPALDFASDVSQDMQAVQIAGMEASNFAMFLVDSFAFESRVMHSALHYALTTEDTEHLVLIASIPGKLENSAPDWVNLAELKFWIASVLFEKGHLRDAIQSWCQIAASSDVPHHWWIKPVQTRSLSRLAAVCLYYPEISFCGDAPLVLPEDDVSEVSLIVSSWLSASGDIFHARKLLSEAVRRCIALLSDDDPANDIDAFVMLFKVFLLAMDSDDDLRAALYLIKAWNKGSDDAELRHNTEEEVQHDLSSSLDRTRLADDETQVEDQNPDDDQTRTDDTWRIVDTLSECSTCKHEIISINEWYFCRSCPLTALCRPCYCDLQSSSDTTLDHPHGITGKCNPQHQFFYSGPALRQAEYVPKGMVPMVGSGGQRHVVWIEEWMDTLLEKWTYTDTETADSSDGGLPSWCMEVLPQAQRDRWEKFFMV